MSHVNGNKRRYYLDLDLPDVAKARDSVMVTRLIETKFSLGRPMKKQWSPLEQTDQRLEWQGSTFVRWACRGREEARKLEQIVAGYLRDQGWREEACVLAYDASLGLSQE